LPGTRLVWAGAVAFFLIIVSWALYAALSGKNGALQEVDLKVYWDGGLIVRHVAPYYNPHYYDPLYGWGGTGKLALKFTYTPFAAIAFALISFIPLTALYSISVVVNIVTFTAAIWFTCYGLGYRDRRVRAAVILSGAKLPGITPFRFPGRSPPLLATQGTADTTNRPYYTDQFFALTPRPKFLLRLLGTGHLSPYTTHQPQLGIVERASIAFLQRYLDGDDRALARLRRAARVRGVSVLDARP